MSLVASDMFIATPAAEWLNISSLCALGHAYIVQTGLISIASEESM